MHPLVSFVLLQSSFGLSSARALARSSSSRGVFCPLRDISTRSPRLAGHPEPDDVPPAAFRTLSTACSSPCLARLFRRAAVSRVSLQGFDSSDRAVPPRRWPSPSRRWRRPPAGCPAPANVASTSGSCSRPESAVSDEVVHPAVTRVPSCVFISLGRFTGTWAVPSHVLRSRPSWCGAACAPDRDPQRIDQFLRVASVPRGCSRSSFPAFESVALLARPISS
jgi:hypothetical protein